ncbi:DUF5662 family protein [Methanobrevibacter sp. OttesenSCG-928-K11]|nr:DUF5662 family protein [Methanobrevibacter sp. OttesenSCG-928-K11]MDL2270926.1 DUF5662 family protein [Methanobrevibacter sp. OttesenSCG-928-I08]
MVIYIKDTRTNNEKNKLTKEEIKQASVMHKADVMKGMIFFSDLLLDAGLNHDWTKLAYLEEIYTDYEKRLEDKDFSRDKWNKLHQSHERHHLNSAVPDDVNLVDVLEFIVDCVMAGIGRFGEIDFKYLELPEGTLEKAYMNTINMLQEEVETLK